MNQAKLVVVWRITEACNLACPFCAYSRTLHRPRATARLADVERFGALLGAYAAQTQRPILVSWLGGEPLMWKPFFEMSSRFKNEFGLQLSVTTNGTALNNEATLPSLAADFDELTVSVDGLAAEHDSLRGQAGLWASLQANLRQLADLKSKFGRGPRIRVNTILMRDTIYDFENLCLQLAQWGVEEVTFNALGGRDRPEFFPAHGLLPAQLDWFRTALPGIRTRLGPMGLAILGNGQYLDRLSAFSQNHYLSITDCHPGAAFWFIDEQGVVAPCSYSGTGYGVPISEVNTLADLDQLPQQFASRQQTNRLAVCNDCPSTQVFGKFAIDSTRL